MASDLASVLQGVGRPHILVVGDLMLDQYTYGNVTRVSPEAPVPILVADSREDRLGGAANVCRMLAGLQASVEAVGIVGPDANGRTLRQLLSRAGIQESGVLVDESRCTTTKERFVGRVADRHAHQILRVDTEVTDSLSDALGHALTSIVVERLTSCQGILISDYNKGVCSPYLLRTILERARDLGIPTVVDPARGVCYNRYRGASILKPNALEAELATGHKIVHPEDAIEIGRTLQQNLEADTILVTLGSEGAALISRNGAGEIIGTKPRRVYDVTGAGDIVASMIALCLADGVPLHDAVCLANIAGGIEVERLGGVIVTRDEVQSEFSHAHGTLRKILTLEQLVARASIYRSSGKKVVLTNGCFDLLHAGHVTYLQAAAAMGEILIVAVNSDASITRLKGPKRPVIGEADRAALLAALSCVDHVIIFEQDTPHLLLGQVRPDILVKGGTYRIDEVVGREIVTEYGGEVRVTGAIPGISTTDIIETVKGN